MFLPVEHLGAQRLPAAVDVFLSLLQQLGVGGRRLSHDVVAGSIHAVQGPLLHPDPRLQRLHTPATPQLEHTRNTTA